MIRQALNLSLVVARSRFLISRSYSSASDTSTTASNDIRSGHPARVLFFPGQGTESPGMLSPLLEQYPSSTREGIEALGEVLPSYTSKQLSRLLLGPADGSSFDAADQMAVHKTSFAQPAILLTSVLIYNAYVERFGKFNKSDPTGMNQFMIGHSLGQITALVAAGCLTLEQGLKISAERGRLMEEITGDDKLDPSHNTGLGMFAISMPIARKSATDAVPQFLNQTAVVEIINNCADLYKRSSPGAVAEIANINSPDQLVMSGQLEAIEQVLRMADSKINEQAPKMGTLFRRKRQLPVRIPFHSSILEPIEPQMDLVLKSMAGGFRCPAKTSIIANHEPTKILASKDDVIQAILQGCYRPVYWDTSVRAIVHRLCSSSTAGGGVLWCGIGHGSSVTAKLVDRTLKQTPAHESLVVSVDSSDSASDWNLLVSTNR
ncbi:acyl transferase/acyl hydrolase/lysophospholipase [Lipomyces oligophaga]|uniref:acyl transferase/acyl hydrolase/lysophospholipase n=1 Tax=Lipomyces oligophaga TaxID=45792 RepID=UPI0034CD3296